MIAKFTKMVTKGQEVKDFQTLIKKIQAVIIQCRRWPNMIPNMIIISSFYLEIVLLFNPTPVGGGAFSAPLPKNGNNS